MTATTKIIVKNYFNTGDIPTESNFVDLIDTIGGSPSTVVAASNASNLEKGRADYVCDGVDDQEEINSALVSSNDIRLSAGTFELSDSLTKFNINAKKLIGAGFNQTVLNFTPNSTKDLIIIGDSTLGAGGYGRKHIFQGFSVIGKNTNARYGLHLVYGASWNVFENLWVEGFTHGLLCTTDSSQNRFRSIQTRNCTTYGIQVYGSGNNFFHCEAHNDALGSTAGIRIQGSACNFYGCITDACNIGFSVAAYTEACNLFGIYAEACGQGLVCGGGVDDYPKSVHISGGLITSSVHATSAAIQLARSQGVNIEGVYVKNSTSDISLSADANVLNCYLINNLLSDGTPTNIDPSADVTIL